MFVSANGISTFYERFGRGFPVVLIHALGSSSRSWAPVVRSLSQRYDVVAYDWRGHGRSEKAVGDYTLPLLARDLAGLLSALDIDRACLVGVAIGSMIALQTVLDYPDRVTALILAEACSQVEESAAQHTEQRAATVEREGMRVAVDSSIERSFPAAFRVQHPDVINEYRGDFLANDPHGYGSASRVLIGLNVTHRLMEVRCPTLLLVGELDQHFPPAASELVRRHISGSRLEVLPGIGHFSNIEAPDLIAQHALTFLNASENVRAADERRS